MFRIVTARRLRALESDLVSTAAERDQARREAADAKTTADLAEAVVDQQLRQLAQAYADNIKLQRENAERFAGLQAVIKQVTAERDAARTLTPNEHDRAWHAIEGGVGEDGADPGTVLAAVLRALNINAPTVQDEQAASPRRKTAERLVLAVADLDSGEQPDTDTAGLDDAEVRREGIVALATVFTAAFSSTEDEYDGVGIADPWAAQPGRRRRDDHAVHTDPWPTEPDGVDLRALAAESAAARLDTDQT